MPRDTAHDSAHPAAGHQLAQAPGGAAPIGRVETIAGTVTAQHPDGTVETLSQGASVYQRDLIQTQADAKVALVFADKTTFALGESGQMRLDEMVYNPAGKDGKIALSMLKGAFAFVSGDIAATQADAMTVRTPVGTIGIRGTAVTGNIDITGTITIGAVVDPSGAHSTIVFTNGAGTVVVTENFSISVSSFFSAPSAPFASPGGVADALMAIASAIASSINPGGSTSPEGASGPITPQPDQPQGGLDHTPLFHVSTTEGIGTGGDLFFNVSLSFTITDPLQTGPTPIPTYLVVPPSPTPSNDQTTQAIGFLGTLGTDHFVGTPAAELFNFSHIPNSLQSDDFVDGGGGNDTLTALFNKPFSIDATLTIKNVPNIEIALGGGANTLDALGITAGSSGPSTITVAGNGSLTVTDLQVNLDAHAMTDTLVATAIGSYISIEGGAAANSLTGAGYGHGDFLSYQHAASAVDVNFAAGTATHGAFTDTITGFDGVIGSAFDDNINVSLTGGGHSITVEGGAGNNTLTGALSDHDWLSYQEVPSGVSVSFNDGTGTATNGLGGTDIFSGFSGVVLNSGSVVVDGAADLVTVSGLGNSISDGNGADTISAAGGFDTIALGNGADSLNLSGLVYSVTTGTSAGDDTITGSASFDTIVAYGNNDQIALTGGGVSITINDLAPGGETVSVGLGFDTITVVGDDNLSITAPGGVVLVTATGNGNDTINVGGGFDTVTVGNGNDTITAGDNFNQITAGNGADLISLTGQGSVIIVGAGNDTIVDSAISSGLYGYDTIAVGGGADSFALLSGVDSVTAGNGDDVVTGGGIGFDTVVFGGGDDTISLTAGVDAFSAGGGNDSVSIGGVGFDTIALGNGIDVISLGGSSNVVSVGNGDDTITIGDGFNSVIVGNGDDMIALSTIAGTAGQSFVQTGTGFETITSGGGFNTIIVGGNHDDIIAVTDGSNAISVGNGNDTITIGDGFNSITVGAGDDTIALSTTAGTAGSNFVQTGAGFETVTSGGGFNTIIVGGNHDDLITVTGPVNSISVGNGDDTITTGDGFNSVVVGSGDDMIALSTMSGAAGSNFVQTGTGVETITSGGGFNTIIVGGNYDDVIAIAQGSDSVSVGDGDDTISIGNGFNSIVVGNGDDSISLSGSGPNSISAGYGCDTFSFSGNGESATITINGNYGDDTINTFNNDTISFNGNLDYYVTVNVGGTGDSISITGTGDNVSVNNPNDDAITIAVNAPGGSDTISVGSCQDYVTIIGGAGNNNLYGGGAPHDMLSYANGTQGAYVDFVNGIATSNGFGGCDTIGGFSEFTGTTHNDFIISDDVITFVNGNGGDDTLLLGGYTNALTIENIQDVSVANSDSSVNVTVIALDATSVFDFSNANTSNATLTLDIAGTTTVAIGTDMPTVPGADELQLFGSSGGPGVSDLILENGNYHLVFDGTELEGGKNITLTVDGGQLGASSTLSLDGHLEGGSFDINAGASTNDVISLGDGDDTVTAAGNGASISAGNGDDVISVGGGADTVALGYGDDAVSMLGSNDALTVSAGIGGVITLAIMGSNDTVTLFATSSCGYGDVTINDYGVGNTVTVLSDDAITVNADGNNLSMTLVASNHGFEDLIGIFSNGTADTITVLGSDDAIEALGGNETVTGYDTIVVGGNFDSLYIGSSPNSGPNVDVVTLTGNDDALYIGSDDSITASLNGLNETIFLYSPTDTALTLPGNDETLAIVTSFSAGSADTISVSGGFDTIALSGYGTNFAITVTGNDDSIATGTGQDTISIGGNANTLSFTAGCDAVTVFGSSDSLTIGGGFQGNEFFLTASGSNDTVSMSLNHDSILVDVTGTGNVVSLSGSDDFIEQYNSNQTFAINVSGSSDQIDLYRNFDGITVGGTANVVVHAFGGSGDDTITVGNGDDFIYANSGGGNSITAGNGADTMLLYDVGHDTISVGSGNDTIGNFNSVSGGGDSIALGSGTDQISFATPTNSYSEAPNAADTNTAVISGFQDTGAHSSVIDLTGLSGVGTESFTGLKAGASFAAAFGADAANAVDYAVIGGNTYVHAAGSSGGYSAGDLLVELTGAHTLTAANVHLHP